MGKHKLSTIIASKTIFLLGSPNNIEYAKHHHIGRGFSR